MLLTARSRAAKKEAIPHPYYGRKLLTQRLLNQREREASIKPTATIGINKGLDEAAGGKKRALYLNDTRTVSEDGNNFFPRTMLCSPYTVLWLGRCDEAKVNVPVLLCMVHVVSYKASYVRVVYTPKSHAHLICVRLGHGKCLLFDGTLP